MSKDLKDNTDLMYRIASKRFDDHSKKSRHIDIKAGAALALMLALLTTPIFQTLYLGLDLENQILVIVAYLVVVCALLCALYSKRHPDLPVYRILEDCTGLKEVETKLKLLDMYYECDKKNHKLLMFKSASYHTALLTVIIAVIYTIATFVFVHPKITVGIVLLVVLVALLPLTYHWGRRS